VRGVAVGDAVAAMADLNGDGGWGAAGGSGGEGSYAVAHEFLTVRKPPPLSFRDAAALPMCFLSAFAGLYRAVQAGDTVYIPGGGGGVGHLAVQMAARALGAGLVISSGSAPQSIALTRQSGAQHVFDYKRDDIAAEIAKLTSLPFVSAPNKFTVQGAHDALVQLSGALRTLAVSLYKIANDIRLMSCGPRAGFAELIIPSNEPGSSIMPGKVNPTQAEALTMIAVQVMANDVAVGFGGAGGYLEMNVYKPLIIFNVTHSITILTDGCTNFRKFLVEGTKPNLKKIQEYVDRSLMLVTALSPVIGYDKASKIAHFALDNDLTLKQAALKLAFVTEDEFDRVVDPLKMVHPYIAKAS